MFKYLCLAIVFLSLIPASIGASENGVVLQSFRISGESSTDEYVEIFNSSTVDVNLSGWRLAKKTASGNSSNLLTTFPEILIEPETRLIIGHENCLCSPDLKYSTSGSISEDNTIILYSDNGKTVVDKVGFGAAIDFEEAPIVNPEKLEIYGRNDKGLDTDNNKNDFKIIYSPPKPKPEEKNVVPVSTPSETKPSRGAQIIVTEFMPNPEGPDSDNEFIEIKNVGPKADIGGYYIRDTIGSPKTYKIPKGTTINQGQYLAFYSSVTPISLNNSGDGVEVLDPDKKVIDSSTDDCGKAPENASYALSDKGWVWTTTPTPGKANVINEPSETGSDKEGAEVLSAIDESELNLLESQGLDQRTENDKMLGLVLVVVAILGGIIYTLYANKEKVVEVYNAFRTRNDSVGEKIRKRLKGR